MARQPLVGQGLIIEAHDHTHLETPYSVRLLSTSDQPDTETSTWQHTILTRDIHDPVGFEPEIPASERPQIHTVYRATTGISQIVLLLISDTRHDSLMQ